MPATILYRAGMHERFLFEVDKQQRERDVEVRELQRGALPIRSFDSLTIRTFWRCASPTAMQT